MNQVELARNKTELESLEGETTRLETRLNQDKTAVQSKASLINREIAEAEKAGNQLEEERFQLSEIEERLTRKDFAIAEQKALVQIVDELAKLDYNSQQHEQTSKTRQNSALGLPSWCNKRRAHANYGSASQASARNMPSTPSVPKRVRCVAYFNPEIFARQRWIAETKVRELESLVNQLNQRLQNPRSRLTSKGAMRTVEDRLRPSPKLPISLRSMELGAHDLLDAFDVKTDRHETEAGSCVQLSLSRHEQQWQRRRSFDGFTVLVAHTKVDASAAELCRTYRAKNAVENDFHVIKSLVKLRPVRHRTDVKVRAHVALCMLALYVQRELTLKLKNDDLSAELAFEHLETCHVDLYAGRDAGGDAYVVPLPSREQTKILKRLGLTRLVDQREVGLALRPRSEFASTEPHEVA